MRKQDRVMEPVQAYLDESDAGLLESIADRTALPKAEVIRRGIRRLAQDLDVAARPFSALGALTGALDGVTGVPSALAARHDEYFYGDQTPKPAKTRRR